MKGFNANFISGKISFSEAFFDDGAVVGQGVLPCLDFLQIFIETGELGRSEYIFFEAFLEEGSRDRYPHGRAFNYF